MKKRFIVEYLIGKDEDVLFSRHDEVEVSTREEADKMVEEIQEKYKDYKIIYLHLITIEHYYNK